MTDLPTILLDTSIGYTSWDITEAGSIEMTEWQPIETAPKDGTNILVFENPLMVSAYWDTNPKDEGGQVWRILAICEYLYPSHWCPLPAPPANGDAK